MIPAIQGYVLHHSPPTVTVEKGSAIEEANYIVFKDDEGLYYAKNGSTGEIHFASTNASYVINSALAALNNTGAGKVFLKAGTYNIDTTISIPYGVYLEGQGMGRTQWGTKLDWTGGADDVIIYNEAEVLYDNHRRGGISHLYIDGNDLSDACIRLRMSMFHIVEFVSVRDCDEGIVVEASYSQDIRNCDITRNNNYGIHLSDYGPYHCTMIHIYGNEIGNNANYNIYAVSGTRITLTGNWFENDGSYDPQHIFTDSGINLRATDNNFGDTANQTTVMTIQGGDVYLNHNFIVGGAGWDRNGIVMTGGRLHMEGNEVASSGGGAGRALNITNCNYSMIKGNTFIGYSYSNYSIDVSGGENIVIDGNHFTRGGIFSTVSKINIQNNILDDIITEWGIYTTGDLNLIQNNLLRNLEKSGIFVDGIINQIMGNSLSNVGYTNNNTYDAIYVDGSRNKIDNNHIYSAASNKPRYGIYVPSEYFVSITNNHIEHTGTWDIYLTQGGSNLVEGNIIPNSLVSIPVDRQNMIVKDNIGYVTENSSSQSVANNDYIAHSLVATPTSITLTANSTEPRIIQSIFQNSTHFQIGFWNASASPPTAISSAEPIYWYAIYEP